MNCNVLCVNDFEGETSARLAKRSTGSDSSLAAAAAMRFTVKPSLIDIGVPLDLDDHDAVLGSVDCRVRTGTDVSRSPHNTYDPTMTTASYNERDTLIKKRLDPDKAGVAVTLVDYSDVEELKSKSPIDFRPAEVESDDEKERSLGNQDISFNAAGHETVASKTESYAVGTESMLDGSSSIVVPRNLAHLGRKYAARQRRRLVFKDGNCNIASRNVMSRKQKYLVDIFTTMVDMRWRYNVILFTAAFVLSWFAFSVVWFLIAYVHGDTEHADDENWKSCAAHVYDFPTALLFSIESQTTIGYGYRVIEPYCVTSFIVLMAQSCIGVFIQSLMTGIIFAKLSRPKQRAHTLMFSRNAVVCKRDMQYCLLFRVGDMRKSHIIGTSIRAVMVKDRHTKEGEVIPLCQSPLDVQTETCNASDNFVFLVWPVTVVHKIDSSSPVWDISAEQLLSERFEIVVILEGVVESTGGTTQVRTSYLPSEILWGHRLAPLLTYQKENGQYRIDYTQFHSVEPVKMPECSARTFAADSWLHPADDEDDDDHVPVYFTAPAVKMSAARNKLGIIKRMKSGMRLRRHKSLADSDRPDNGLFGRRVSVDVMATSYDNGDSNAVNISKLAEASKDATNGSNIIINNNNNIINGEFGKKRLSFA